MKEDSSELTGWLNKQNLALHVSINESEILHKETFATVASQRLQKEMKSRYMLTEEFRAVCGMLRCRCF